MTGQPAGGSIDETSPLVDFNTHLMNDFSHMHSVAAGEGSVHSMISCGLQDMHLLLNISCLYQVWIIQIHDTIIIVNYHYYSHESKDFKQNRYTVASEPDILEGAKLAGGWREEHEMYHSVVGPDVKEGGS